MDDEPRKEKWPGRAVSIYEVHLGSWRRVPEEGNRPLTYREMAVQLADYVHEAGLYACRVSSRHGVPIRWLLGV